VIPQLLKNCAWYLDVQFGPDIEVENQHSPIILTILDHSMGDQRSYDLAFLPFIRHPRPFPLKVF